MASHKKTAKVAHNHFLLSTQNLESHMQRIIVTFLALVGLGTLIYNFLLQVEFLNAGMASVF